MFQQSEEPRFTIEQIDLLQRLRRTGISQAEVLHALDTLDHLDRQHGHRPARKTAYVPPVHHFTSSSTTSASTQTTFPENRFSLSPAINLDPSSPPLTVSTSTLPITVGVVQNGLVSITNGKLSPPRFPLAMVGGNMPGQGYVFEASEDYMDVDEKVEDLMRRDSAVIKEEIKSFLANRRISQAVVAQVTGISQSRISHWLLQQGSDLSEQKKRAFFRWYQLEKTNPGATLAMRAPPIALDEMVEWHQTPLPFNAAPTGFRLRRGSRFTWRKECLAVMESYFGDNQYPDEAKREEIATACNAVIQKPGKKLSDLERVTSLKVYNWFANRRKDIKRRANIEAAILESHGIEVQSPGSQSVIDEVDGNDFPDQGCEASLLDKRSTTRQLTFSRADLSPPTQVPTPFPSWFSALARGAMSGQRGISLTGRSMLSGSGAPPEVSRLAGVSWSPPSPSLQEDTCIQGVLVEQQDAAAPQKNAADAGSSPGSGSQPEGGSNDDGNQIKMETPEDD